MDRASHAQVSLRGRLQGETIWNLGLGIFVFSTLAIVLCRTAADPDLWGHLRFGLDNLQAGRIIQIDPYSYTTAGQRWINHEWLSEVLFGLAWNLLASPGLILLKVLTGFLTLGILYIYSGRFLKLPNQQSLILLLLGSLPIIPYLFHIRPQAFTYLFFTIILFILYQAEQGELRWLYVAPPVMALWVNLHGGVLAGLGMLWLWTILHLLTRPHHWRQVLPFSLASLAGALLNPYGIELPLFLIRTATVPRPEIQDWQPLALVSPLGALYFLVFICAVLGIALSSLKKNPILIILFGIAAFLPWLATRHLPLFSIAAVILVGEHIGSALKKARKPQSENRLPIWMAGLPFLAIAFLAGVSPSLNLFKIHLVEQVTPPAATVTLLKQSGVAGNLATDFGWGEYIIWHLGPSIKVSIDGRRETVYPPEAYTKNIHFLIGDNNWEAVLEDYPTEMALVKRGSPSDNLLKLHPGWILVFADGKSALFVKQDSTILQPLQKAARDYLPSEEDKFFP